MKIRILTRVATLVMLWGIAATVGATDQATGTESTNPPAAVTAVENPSAVLPELKYEFDPVVDGSQITHDFVIKNAGKGPLAISQVKTG